MRNFLFFCLSFQLFGQVMEQVQSVVRDLRVHVVDGNNQPVSHLQASDFLVLQNGKDCPLTFFEEVDLAAQPDPTDSRPETTRTLVIYFDTSNMSRATFQAAQESLATLLDGLQPSDLVKLVHMDRRLDEGLPFTRDKKKLKLLVKDLAYSGAQRTDITALEREIIEEIGVYNSIGAYGTTGAEYDQRYAQAQKIDTIVARKEHIKSEYYRSFYNSLFYLAQILSQMSGSKSLFIISGGSYLDRNGQYTDSFSLNEDLSAQFNNAGVTVYAFLQADPFPPGRSQLSAIGGDRLKWDQWDRSSSFAESEGFTSNLKTSQNTVLENTRQLETGVREPADLTGGFFVRNTDRKQTQAKVNTLLSLSSHYYRLVVPLDEPNKPTSFKVKYTGKENYSIHFGAQLAPQPEFTTLDTEQKEMVLRALLFYNKASRNDLNVDWQVQVVPRAEGGWTSVVLGRWSPNGRRFESAIATLDAQQDLLDNATATFFPFQDQHQMPTHLSYYDVLLTREKPHFIRCILRDAESGAYALQQIPIDTNETEGMRVLGLWFNDATSYSLALNQKRKTINPLVEPETDARVVEDPFWIGKIRFQPSFLSQLPRAGCTAFVCVQTVEKNPPNLQFLARTANGWIPINAQLDAAEFYGSTWRAACRLDLSKLPQGPVKIWVKAQADEQESLFGQIVEISAVN